MLEQQNSTNFAYLR